MLEQQRDDERMPLLRRLVERSVTERGARVHTCAILQQKPHHVYLSKVTGNVKRSVTRLQNYITLYCGVFIGQAGLS